MAYRNSYRNMSISKGGKYKLLRLKKGATPGDFIYVNHSTGNIDKFYNLRVLRKKKPYQKPIVNVAQHTTPKVVNTEIIKQPKINSNIVIKIFVVFTILFAITNILFSDDVGGNAVDSTLNLAKMVGDFGKESVDSFKAILNFFKSININLPSNDTNMFNPFNPFASSTIWDYLVANTNTMINAIGFIFGLLAMALMLIKFIMLVLYMLFGG